MCVYSAVFDHFTPQFDKWVKPVPYQPTYPISPITIENEDAIRKLIEEFQQAAEHAKKLDEIMKKPDCEDPDKAKLLERIAKIEEELAKLKKVKKTTKKK